MALAAYRGTWLAGVTKLNRLLSGSPDAGLGHVQERIAEALRRISPLAADTAPELDFWAMIQAERQREDKLAQPPDYAAATARPLEKSKALIADLRPGDGVLAELEQLAALAARPDMNADQQRAVYLRTRWLKRPVLLSNPQMQFGPLLFAKRVPTSYSHLVMQYFGWRARPGGGLFVLDQPGRSLVARDLLDGQLAGGNVLEPRLSYDAQRIIFSFSKCTQEDPFYHIYEVRTDGTNLRQLTDGEFEDLMPNNLPDGGILRAPSVFSRGIRKGGPALGAASPATGSGP